MSTSSPWRISGQEEEIADAWVRAFGDQARSAADLTAAIGQRFVFTTNTRLGYATALGQTLSRMVKNGVPGYLVELVGRPKNRSLYRITKVGEA